MPILLGQKDAKCPQCGGSCFASIPTGKLIYRPLGVTIEMTFKQNGVAYLCGTPDCKLRVYTMDDLKAQEEEGKRIIEGG